MTDAITTIPIKSFQAPVKYYTVKNWKKYQHYKNRNPSWIKLHCKILRSKRWIDADEPTRLLMIVILLVAADNCGVFPNDPHLLKKLGFFRKTPNLKPLIDNEFIIEMLADASEVQDRERVRDRVREEKKDAAIAAPDPIDSQEIQLFRRAKEICGKSAGGLCTKLLKSKSGNVALARAILETASTKENPREYIGRIIAGQRSEITEGSTLWRDPGGPIL